MNLSVELIICIISIILITIPSNVIGTKSAAKHEKHTHTHKTKKSSTTMSPAKQSYKTKKIVKMMSPDMLQKWADEISDKFHKNEKYVVRRDVLLRGYSDVKSELRDGTAIVGHMSKALSKLLEKRIHAAETIMRRAEALFETKEELPADYQFYNSVELDKIKQPEETESDLELPNNCIHLDKMSDVSRSDHFDADVSLHNSSVYVVTEVFGCDERVLKHVYWSEGLTAAFRQNYARDASLDFQYFCSAKGFLRFYPAANWESLFKVEDLGPSEVYDCRLQSWYLTASGAPRDFLILLDASGSMRNSSNKVIAEKFTLAMLSALTDDDQVNVLRFNVEVESPISCFNDILVPANHVNSAAMMAAMEHQIVYNETDMEYVLKYAVSLLQKQKVNPDTPYSCQQAIVLVTDSLYGDFTDILQSIDPEGRIRVFVLWLHDPFGLRDNTKEYGEWIACMQDGSFAEFITHADVTEQVIKIMQVMERPLVKQRKDRLHAFSDIYANVEDPRRSEHYWTVKEKKEQKYRYELLRDDKEKLLSSVQLYNDYMLQYSMDNYGHYYEGYDLNYRLQISVSVPVFESTTFENITIKLAEEKERNSTRTYPVNRLLGVAGVDIPIDHLKLYIPYYQLGGGGSLFLLDHRGNTVLHDNLRPTFDGDILKPGYRTVDVFEVEQHAQDHRPRFYPDGWLDFRNELVLNKPKGSRMMFTKNIFENGMRANREMREYFWERILEHYTAVVVLPEYGRQHAAPAGDFTQQLANDAFRTLNRTDFSVHPDWLYCQHIEPHFKSRRTEILHFIERRQTEPNFAMNKLEYFYSPLETPLLEKNYECDEKLISRLCHDALATEQWSLEHEVPDAQLDCVTCYFGSVTAFFTSESGLTRWQLHHHSGTHGDPPKGSVWPRGPTEPWYTRAAAAPSTLVVHAPVLPVRRKRISYERPPKPGQPYEWMTAARVLSHPNKGVLGVAGFHFHPSHLENMFSIITNSSCTEDFEQDCEVRCDGNEWSCVLIDEGGWIVAGARLQNTSSTLREHLATAYPSAMFALLEAKIFKLNWVHDYQAVCFPPEKEALNAASSLTSLVTSVLRSFVIVLQAVREIIIIVAILNSGQLISADTTAEKEKRRNRIRKDFATEVFERLYDPRVNVNRTRFAACDRSRALYELQRTPGVMEALRRTPSPCSWPVTGVPVAGTNLVLLAIYNNCTNTDRLIPNPYVNELVKMSDESGTSSGESAASQLACWRNRVPLPGRVPHTTCYPHLYAQEAGYRQCGPWLPDPENKAALLKLSPLIFINVLVATRLFDLYIFSSVMSI